MDLHTALDHGQMIYVLSVAEHAEITARHLSEIKSPLRPHAFRIILAGPGAGRGPSAFGDEWSAATWDHCGIFFGLIFDADPSAVVAGAYNGKIDFHWQTGDRFHPGKPIIMCDQHAWIYDPARHAQECNRGCGSLRRWARH